MATLGRSCKHELEAGVVENVHGSIQEFAWILVAAGNPIQG